MPTAPVEYMLVAFPGNQFNGRILPALHDLVDTGIIHIIDLLFVKKDAAGNVLTFELNALSAEEQAFFDDLDGDIENVLSPEDIAIAAHELDVNSSAALLVWENLWAERFADAVRSADGIVLANERIPHDVVEAAHAELWG